MRCITDTAIRERRSIRLLLYEQFTCKFFHHTTFAVMFNEGIVLFCRTLGQRCKPVRVMSDTHFDSPFFHAGSYLVGNAAI